MSNPADTIREALTQVSAPNQLREAPMKTWRNATMRWVVRDYAAGTKGLDEALAKGWEPFAATVTKRGQTRVWVRRSKWGA